PLLLSSRALYPELIDREALDCEFESRGMLFAYRSPREMQAYAVIDRLMSEAFACPARRLDAAELIELEPALPSGLAGRWHYRGDAHLGPDKGMGGGRGVLEAGGVTTRANCALRGFVAHDGRALAAQTEQGELTADVFVVATGAWTPLLNEHLGCRIPIQP